MGTSGSDISKHTHYHYTHYYLKDIKNDTTKDLSYSHTVKNCNIMQFCIITEIDFKSQM